MGNGERCCLGHGCYILGIPRVQHAEGIPRLQHAAVQEGYYSYDGDNAEAPQSFVDMVGLWSRSGRINGGQPFIINGKKCDSLVRANDGLDATPQQIGQYLLSVIEGGDDTPFVPLSDYPTRK